MATLTFDLKMASHITLAMGNLCSVCQIEIYTLFRYRVTACTPCLKKLHLFFIFVITRSSVDQF